MKEKTSVHVKPCYIGQSEAHNRREEAYIAHFNKAKKNLYIRRDLIPLNDSWISERMEDRSLTQYLDDIAIMVKQKTGRAMQRKERKCKDEKTGRVKTKTGCSAIREGVVVCKADTTMEQLHRFAQLCHAQFGITAIQIHIHRDEGHYENPDDKSSWKTNNHAHIVWDWMDHETGTTIKLNVRHMSAMQNLAAEALDMERGDPKEETGREHLERNDFIVAKQKEEAKNAKQETESEKLKTEVLQRENEEKTQLSAKLDKEIAEKTDKVNREHGNKILQGGAALVSSIANLAGMGKFAAIQIENNELKEAVPKRLEQLQQSFNEQVQLEVERATAPLIKENEELRKQLEIEKKSNRQLEDNNNVFARKLEQVNVQLEQMKNNLQAFLNLMIEPCRSAVNAVIDFVNSKEATFTFSQASHVNGYLLKGNNREHKADYLSFLSRPFISDEGHAKGKRELNNVATNFKWYEKREENRRKKAEQWKANEVKKPDTKGKQKRRIGR